MTTSWRGTTCLLGAALATSMILFLGCRIQSADSVVRSVGINVSGVYRGNSPLVRQNTGASIHTLNVIQDGDRLQGVDNNGMIFRGNLGRVIVEGNRASATFNMKGQTTAGAEGIMSGTFTVTGTEATMTGTWAEPSLFSTIEGSATVAPIPTNGPPNGVTNNNNSATNNFITNITRNIIFNPTLRHAQDNTLPVTLRFMADSWDDLIAI